MTNPGYVGAEGNDMTAGIISDIRTRLGYSQPEFGAMLGAAEGLDPVRQSTLSHWERGEVTIPAAILVACLKIARDHGIDPAMEVQGVMGRAVLEPDARQASAYENLERAILNLVESLPPNLSEPLSGPLNQTRKVLAQAATNLRGG